VLFKKKEQTSGRPEESQVIRRLHCLRAVLVVGYSPPFEYLKGEILSRLPQKEAEEAVEVLEAKVREAWVELRQADAWNELSPTERELSVTPYKDVSPRQQINAMWRIEAFGVLMWALRLVPNLLPGDVPAELDKLQPIGKPSLRPAPEIDLARDVAETWHWRCRTQQLVRDGYKFEATPQMLKAGIKSLDDIVRQTAKLAHQNGDLPQIVDEDWSVFGKAFRDLDPDEYSNITSMCVERHYALNWLCGRAPGNRWDETPTDT